MIFRAGDRVVLLEDYPDDNEDLRAGALGTALANAEVDSPEYRDVDDPDQWVPVRWDEAVTNGHSCSGRCEDGHGWNVPRRMITLLVGVEVEVNDSDIAGLDDLCSFIGIKEFARN